VSLPERAGRIATYLWLLAVAVVLALWLRDPSLFTPESIADLMRSWGPWVFAGFVGVALVRGLFLVPSTPVILAGGILFPGSLVTVFLISLAGVVLSASVIYLMPGLGGYDDLLERKYPETIRRVRPHLEKPRAFWVVAAWSFFPLVPTDVICYVAGLVQMSYWRMMLALLLGEIPLVVGYLVLTQRVR
jgi:uncharacterized membrane protein YdjX (TVP38/TMEM64 family)